MVLFLAINTSGLALLPTGIIGVRALKGSVDAAAIFPTTLIATACSTVIGIMGGWSLSPTGIRQNGRLPRTQPTPYRVGFESCFPLQSQCCAWLAGVVGLHGGRSGQCGDHYMLIFGMLLVGFVRKVKVYEVFVQGAKEGFSSPL